VERKEGLREGRGHQKEQTMQTDRNQKQIKQFYSRK
jgi:hypothetical protein